MFLLAMIGTLWAADVDYVDIQKGESAPFSGKIFTIEALSQMISVHESQINRLELENQYNLKNQKTELDLKYDLYALQCDANEDMYKKMIEKRDTELSIQAKKDWVQRLSFYAGFALGTASAIAITYSVNQN